MVEVNFVGNFLTAKSCIDGEIAEILDEGEWKDITFNNQKKKVFNLKVNYLGNESTYTPTQTQGATLQKAWSTDTKAWIGKKFQTFLIQGKMAVKVL